MKMIYKYELPIQDMNGVDMPKGALVLSVQNQRGICCLWALVDNSKPKQKRVFQVFGTGQPLTTANRDFIGTIQQGPFVWHVFELLEG